MATKPSDEESRIWADLDAALERERQLVESASIYDLSDEERQAIEDNEQQAALEAGDDGCLFALLPLVLVGMGLAVGVVQWVV